MAKKTTASSATPAPRRRAKPIAAVAAGTSHSGNGGVNPTPEEIAEAAYHRYLSRGGNDGADFDDWVEAERELRSRSTSKSQ